MRRAVVLLSIVAASCSSGDPRPREPVPQPIVVRDAVAIVDDAPSLRLPIGASPLAYDVRLELDPDRDTFSGRVAIRVKLAAPAARVWLHADELAIDKASWTAQQRTGAITVGAQTEHEMHALAFGETLPAGEVTLELAYSGHVGDDVEGLFRQRFGGKWFLYAQSEATYARRIVPCFDEPRFKVPWRVTLVVPAGQVALANAPALAERALDKRREITFAEMPALPTHLFAIAVGPFAMVDLGRAGKRGVPVRMAVAPKDAKRVAGTAAWVGKLVDALEQYFDTPLPLAKLDLVAVPRFFGAMENPGLITFEVTALVGDHKQPSFLRRHVRFLAHELAHQWVGNSVTPAWWDDLWLAEAFATWLDDKLSNALGTLDDPALRTQLARAHALAADRELPAKPLRRPIASNDDIEDAFDAISYEKGAAVIAMFERFVGEDRFRDVMRAYIAHPGTASAQDFVAALAKVDAAAAKAFADYLERGGAPIVDLAIDCTGSPRVVASPRDGASVPVCVRHPAGTACALATGPTPIALASCPAWVVGNADGRGYYHTQWAKPPPAAPLAPAERLAHGEDRAAAIARGELAKPAVLDELDALLATRDPYAELAAIAMAVELDHTIDEASARVWGERLAMKFAKRLTQAAIWQPRTPVDFAAREALVELVPPAAFPRDTRHVAAALVLRALKEGPTILRSSELVVAIALAAPAGGKPLYERIVTAAAANLAFADEWFAGLAYFDASFAPRAVELVLDKRFEPDRAWAAIGGMLERTPTRDAAWRAVHARLGELLATLGATESARMIEATAALCDAPKRKQVETAFAPHVSTISGGKRALDHALASIDRCLTSSGARTGSAAP